MLDPLIPKTRKSHAEFSYLQAIPKHGAPTGSIVGVNGSSMDMISLQAKRYTTANVPILGNSRFCRRSRRQTPRKGVFITTSGFQRDASDYAQTIECKTLVLIDGRTLAHLMLKHEIGFSVTETYKIGRIDKDYFDEETGT